MVVLSVAICTKTGKALLSRQFVETSRIRIEGLLAAFPKLINTNDASKQHTFVETDNVRYVYLPLETLYLVLVTNKGSNIIEDLDSLRLLARVLPEQCVGLAMCEETVVQRAFELLFAIDEVIAAGGYREDVTANQIRVNLEMESHEEKLAQMIKVSKMAEAKEAAKRKATELREREREQRWDATRITGISSNGGGGGGGMGGMGGDDDPYYRGARGPNSGISSHTGGGSSGRYDGGMDSGNSGSSSSSSSAPAPAPARKAGGLKLGGKGKSTGGPAGGLAELIAEEGLKAADLGTNDSANAEAATSAQAAAQVAAAAAAAASADHATAVLEEHLTVRLTRDGACDGMEVKGILNLTVHQEQHAKLKVLVAKGEAASSFSYQTHPNLNKNAWQSEGVLALKQSDRPFPVSAPIGVLKWRQQLKDDDGSAAPLALTVWPEETGPGVVTVNLEYTLQAEHLTLHDVVITVPLPGGAGADAPQVPSTPSTPGSSSSWKHNTRENVLTWHIDTVTAKAPTGTLEFTLRAAGGGRRGAAADINVDGFFPVNVNFNSETTLCPLDVEDIVAVEEEGGKSLRHTVSKALVVDSYTVE